MSQNSRLVTTSYRPDFTVYVKYSCNNSPLAQSAEQGAKNAKVMSSRLIRNIFHFLCGLLSIF